MGVYTRTQLLDSGIGRSGIERRLRNGELVRLFQGIFADADPSYQEQCVAVTVWREDAVLSHLSAAWVWGLTEKTPIGVHATVPQSARPSSPDWLTLHRRSVAVTHRHDLPVVSAAQCFVDVATTLDGSALEKFFDRNIGGRVSWRALHDHCESAKGMTGMARVREQLQRCCPGTWSEPERMVARAVRARGLRMEINAPIGPYIGDLVCFRARVDVEIDGREFHSAPAPFDNDRVRQNWMLLDDWLVLRFSAATVYRDVDRVADQIVAVVRRRRRSRGAQRS